jgi:hypothetical protein
MVIPPLLEIGAVMVSDSGVANYERVVFRPTEPINLAQFGVMVGLRQPNGMTTPLRDFFFWFGDLEVRPPCWVVLYTRKGEYKQEPYQKTGEPVYYFHWGRETTLFNIQEIIPLVFRMGGIMFGSHLNPPRPLPPPPAQKQLGTETLADLAASLKRAREAGSSS